MKARTIIAFTLIAFVMAMFSLIIWQKLGGNEALFLILGHTAAWVEMVIIFYFRKKPRNEE